jgi:hypothetical protein
MNKEELDKYKELEFAVETLVDYCNNDAGMATTCELIAVEAALERLFKARQKESEKDMTKEDIIELARALEQLDRFAVILEAKVRKECAELCRAEANGRSPLAFDALHECADLILEGYEE